MFDMQTGFFPFDQPVKFVYSIPLKAVTVVPSLRRWQKLRVPLENAAASATAGQTQEKAEREKERKGTPGS